MAYPYPDLVPWLDRHLTPATYTTLTDGHTLYQLRENAADYAAYWQQMPRYVYAECPLCACRYESIADTYRLDGWMPTLDLNDTLFLAPESSARPISCPHLLGTHRLLNLHGLLPTELEYFSNNTGEVPYLTPWFFPADLVSWAVLHALPICRVMNEDFSPSYTAFSLTYFSEDPKEVLRRHYASEARRGAGDREFYPGTLYPPGMYTTLSYDETLYDLESWARRGQLGWLDNQHPDLPLRMGPHTELAPMYHNVVGNRQKYVWRKGLMQPF